MADQDKGPKASVGAVFCTYRKVCADLAEKMAEGGTSPDLTAAAEELESYLADCSIPLNFRELPDGAQSVLGNFLAIR